MSDYEHDGERRAVYRYWAEAIMADLLVDQQVLEYAENIVEIAKSHFARQQHEKMERGRA